MTQVVVDPLTRIEGHLRITTEVENGVIRDAYCSGTMYRGFEQILKGRDPRDASRLTQRICGVCPHAHALASANALDDAFGIAQAIPKGALVTRNIIDGLATIADHAAHIYVLWGPDLANPAYGTILHTLGDAGDALWRELASRFTPFSGTSWVAAVGQKKALQEAVAILGGKMPHQMATIVGGVTCKPTLGDIGKIASYCLKTADFVKDYVLGMSIEDWLAITHDVSPSKAVENVVSYLSSLPTDDFSRGAGWSDAAILAGFGSELVGETLLGLPASLKLDKIGGYSDPSRIGFLSYGEFYAVKDGYTPTSPPGERAYTSGFTDGNLNYENFDHTQVTEAVSRSFYTSGDNLHPWSGETEPVATADEITYENLPGKYSWVKAPRYRGIPSEVGPLAKLINAKEPLIMGLADVFLKNGYSPANVYTRMLARAQDTLIIARWTEKWLLEDLDPNGKFYEHADLSMVVNKRGVGLWEAPRGALGHWIVTDGQSKIANYQLVVPSTCNLSPRDSNGTPGPVEQALIGSVIGAAGNALSSNGVISLDKENENPTAIFHIGRSFDPCMACAVHTIDMKTNETHELRIL